MYNDTVTVVVPVYNGEKYIARCLDSIISQSYKNIQIFVIDDASSDKSIDIIKRYQLMDNRIQCIQNDSRMGVSFTRNKGLDCATTGYIMFLDCDDWIDLDCIEKAINKFKSREDIDIVIWEIKTAYELHKISVRYEYLYDNIISRDMALGLLTHTFEHKFFLSPLLGCKLFKLSLLKEHLIRFFHTIYEDDLFTFQAFSYSQNIGLISGSCLYYYQHQDSITHHFSDTNIEHFFKAFTKLYDCIKEDEKVFYYNHLNKSLLSMIDNMISNTKDPKMQKRYKSIIFASLYEKINIQEFYNFVGTIMV